MNDGNGAARWKAGLTALLLVLAGAAIGVLADRLWLRPTEAAAMPLTPEALVEYLDLGPSDEARVRTILDSLHTEVVSAAAGGSADLATVARDAHARIESALPSEARPVFRSWVADHHNQMIERMKGGMHGPMHPHP